MPPWLLAVGESSGLSPSGTSAPTVRGASAGARIRRSRDGLQRRRGVAPDAGRPPTKLWDVATGTCLLNLNVGDYFHSIAFAPDGQHFAVAYDIGPRSNNPGVSTFKLELGHGIRTFVGFRVWWRSRSFPPTDGSSRSQPRVAGRRLGASIGASLGVLPAPVGRLADSIGMAFDPSGRRFACSVGHEARLGTSKNAE